jgi:hypothetical protein
MLINFLSEKSYGGIGALCLIGDNIRVKAVPLQALTGPEGSSRLRLPDFLRKSTHEGGKVVSPTPSLPQEIFLVLISVSG